ncbi:MAG: hypothetical protein K6F99_00905 [Lachnospiraceae bacterium]|nr:hypothetical protein [Lachnospiraceae bacterium]
MDITIEDVPGLYIAVCRNIGIFYKFSGELFTAGNDGMFTTGYTAFYGNIVSGLYQGTLYDT